MLYDQTQVILWRPEAPLVFTFNLVEMHLSYFIILLCLTPDDFTCQGHMLIRTLKENLPALTH